MWKTAFRYSLRSSLSVLFSSNALSKKRKGAFDMKTGTRVSKDNFFVKFHQRILRSEKYAHVVQWLPSSYMVVMDKDALEAAVEMEDVCDKGVKYPTIARQFRIYGFNRTQRISSSNVLPALLDVRGGAIFWKHNQLDGQSTLSQIKEYRRRAQPRTRRARRTKQSKQGDLEVSDEAETLETPSSVSDERESQVKIGNDTPQVQASSSEELAGDDPLGDAENALAVADRETTPATDELTRGADDQVPSYGLYENEEWDQQGLESWSYTESSSDGSGRSSNFEDAMDDYEAMRDGVIGERTILSDDYPRFHEYSFASEGGYFWTEGLATTIIL